MFASSELGSEWLVLSGLEVTQCLPLRAGWVADEGRPRATTRGKSHPSESRNEWGDAAGMPAPCHQREPQSAADNQSHPAPDAAKLKSS